MQEIKGIELLNFLYEKQGKTWDSVPIPPYNPKMADVFYKAGEIESWGRGFDKIMEVCEKEKAPCPDIDANSRGIMVLWKFMSINRFGVLYRMLTLNTGQTPMSRFGEEIARYRCRVFR